MTSYLKSAYKSARDTVLLVPEIEKKVKAATSNDKWGPTGTQMREIAHETYSRYNLPSIMAVLWKRLNDPGKYWRHVYKSLLLSDYLLRNGSDDVVNELKQHVIQIQTLTEFQHIDEDGKDVGQSVRERAKQVMDLIHDPDRLKKEREKAKATAKKFQSSIGSDTGGGWGYEGREQSWENQDREEREERERERDREERENTSDEEERPPEKPQKVERRATTEPVSRPTTTQQPKKVSAPQENLIDDAFFNVSDVSSKQSDSPFGAIDPFKTSTSTNFGTNQGFNNTFDFNPRGTTPSQPVNNVFSPQQTTNNAFGTSTGANLFDSNSVGWTTFDGSSSSSNNTTPPTEQQQPQEEEAKPEDPWDKAKHLYDLDLTKKDSSSSGAVKTPMGQLSTKTTGASMGSVKTTGAPMGPVKSTGVPPLGTTGFGMGGNTTGLGNPGFVTTTPGFGNPGFVANPGFGTPGFGNPGFVANPGFGMGGNMGMNPGMGGNMGMNPGMGGNMGMNPGMGANMGMNPGMGANMGMNPGYGRPNPSGGFK